MRMDLYAALNFFICLITTRLEDLDEAFDEKTWTLKYVMQLHQTAKVQYPKTYEAINFKHANMRDMGPWI